MPGGLPGAVPGDPAAARVLAAREQEALRTGRDPAALAGRRPRTAKVLAVLVEFDDRANDDFSGFERPRVVGGDPYDCVTEPPGTRMNGPLHNRIPDPAGTGDNNSFWVPDFSPAHYRSLLFTDRGLTKRVRPDLRDPRDGRRGVDVSGQTLRRYYRQMSGGAHTITGAVAGWVRVPHSEAWYGAAACGRAAQDMTGHPANPDGVARLVADAADALGPRFPWADYDAEDVADADGDGDHAEPDGVIDHLVIVHAGKDRSAGGGAEGTYAIWSHSGVLPRPLKVGGKAVSGYMMVPEDAGVGIFAHEYGHDLGLPDLYDPTGTSSPDVEFWDLMASGSHTGPLYQSMPAHLGLWARWVLGWARPRTLRPGSALRLLTLRPGEGVKVDLPAEKVPMLQPHSGAFAWWSGMGQDRADAGLTRDLVLPRAARVRLWMWNSYEMEFDRDRGFVEVSADGGATWARQRVFTGEGEEVTYDLALTGITYGWREDYVDLTAYAGKAIKLRLAYRTDGAHTERGWHVDDLRLTADGAEVWRDDVESGAGGWTASGRGRWTRNDGTRELTRFYLAEWRADPGLRHAYTTVSTQGGWRVGRIRYNAPGLLVWLRDSAHTGNVLIPTLDLPPSIGPKGGLLLVDSHFEPLRRSDGENLPARAQSSNAAFGTRPTPALPGREPQKGVPAFTDARTWYPGLEVRDGQLHYRDFDASVVVPARGPYGTRVVNPDGTPATAFYGRDLGNGHRLGTGDPGAAAHGVRIAVVATLPGGRGALVRVTPAGRAG